MSTSAEQVFTRIYDKHSWGSDSRSGPGSVAEATAAYHAFLESFLRERSIASVVDIGCGDWHSTQNVNWGEVDYTGVDVVKPLVDDLNEKFGNDRRRFVQLDAINDPLPEADLLVVKDVLMHWSNAQVQTFRSQLDRFKYALLTNDCQRQLTSTFAGIPFYSKWQRGGEDIDTGGYRLLRLREEPFNWDLKEALVYKYSHSNPRTFRTVLVKDTKEVLLWERP